MALILLLLLIAIYLDILLFKKRDLELFKKTFKISALKIVLSILLLSGVLIFSGDRGEDVSVLILLLILPWYLLRRSRFIKSVEYTQGQETTTLLSSALGVVIIWFYGVVAFGLFTHAVGILSKGALSEMGDLVLSAIFSTFLIMGLVYQSAQGFSEKDFLANVGLRKGHQPWMNVILVSVPLGVVFAAFSAFLGLSRQVQPETPLNDVLNATQSPSLMVIFVFLAICIAPLIEEIVFRGYFFHVIRKWIGIKWAIFIIAMSFAILHVEQYWGDWLAITMVTLLGFTLTILRAWSGTTTASVITHYVYNGSVMILPVMILSTTNPAYLEYKAYYPYHDAETKETLLKKSIANQPDLSDAYNDLAWLYAEEEKNLNEALELVNKALSYAPDYPAYLDTKVEVLEKLGRYDEAKTIRKMLEK